MISYKDIVEFTESIQEAIKKRLGLDFVRSMKNWIRTTVLTKGILPGEHDIDLLLQEIKFTDKIIFGKLNYNVQSSKFNNSKDYYQECAQKTIKFCVKNNIESHIKFGTQNKNNKKTVKLFTL
jgi:glucose-6-phosphate-specific signal transduction histidine kinase